MANRVHAFKDRDIRRVVKAARAAGVDVSQVAVDPNTGVITVGPARNDKSSATALDQWMANRADQAQGD